MKLWPFGKSSRNLPAPIPAPAPEIEKSFTNYGPVYWPEHVNWQTSGRFDCGRQGRDLRGVAWACVNIISQDISTLRPEVGILEPDGFFRTMPNSQVQAVLDTPNNYMTGLDFLAYIVASLLTGGNLFAWTPRDALGNVKEMHPLHHDQARPYVAGGEVFWQIGAVDTNLIPGLKGRTFVPAREILHVPYMLLISPVMGVSPISAAALSIAQNSAINQQSAAFFGNNSQPSGILSGPNKIGNELAQRIKTHWETNFSGGNFGRTAVLGEGLTWSPLAITAVDAQLIEQLRYTVENVAACFRLPLFMLSDLNRATFRNSEAQNRAYYNMCLRAIIEKLEAALNSHFGFALESQPRAIRFNLEGLLRTDSDTRYANYQKGIAAGFLTINEARRSEAMAPIEGGDEPLVQIQYRPLSQAIKEPTPAPAPAPVSEPPEVEEDPENSDAPPAANIDEEQLNAELARQMAIARGA